MKTISMLAGLALSLNIVIGACTFAMNASRIGLRADELWMWEHLSWLLAEACMAAFFFTLYSRQKN